MSDSLSSRALAKCAELRDSKSLLAGLGAWQALRVAEAVARWKCTMCGGTGVLNEGGMDLGGWREVPCSCAPLRAALEDFCK